MNAAAVAAVVLWAIAAALATPPVAVTRLRPLVPRRQLPTWAQGRADAFPLRLRLSAGIGVAGLVALLLGVPAVAVIPVAVLAGAPVAVLLGTLERPAAKKREARLRADLPQACDLLAACLDAGLPLRTATTLVGSAIGGPISEEFARVTNQTALGMSDDEAWRSVTCLPLARLGAELARSSKAGLVSSDGLRLQADDATVKARSAREERARKVGVQSVVPLMVCFLPAFMLLGIVPIVGGFLAPLFG